MRYFWLNILLLALLCFSVSGCIQIRSSQLGHIIKFVSNDKDSLQHYEWTLMWGEYEANVYSVDLNPVTVFGNFFGDGVTLDRMRLLEAEGLGQFNHLWQFIERNGRIMVYKSGELLGGFTCNNWRMVSRDPLVKLEQACLDDRGGGVTNILLLDVDSNLKSLTYSMFIGGPALIISRR